MQKQLLKPKALYSIIPLYCIGVFLFGLFNVNICDAASTSLTIDEGVSKTISKAITPNKTEYISSNVTYSATDVQDYAIKISYAEGMAGLRLDGGDATIANVADDTIGNNISNAWGYTWTSDTTVDYSALFYKGIPAYGSNNLSGNIESGNNIDPITKKIVFAVNMSDSNPAGHYRANVLLSLIATPAMVTYNITYNANGGNSVPSPTQCVAQGLSGASCTTTLSNTIPTTAAANKVFKEWNAKIDGTGIAYTGGGSITIDGDIVLYAIWKDGRVLNNITYMQDMNSDICANTSINASKTLIDSRDSTNYIVQKFADGKCWMTQNLKIINKTITSADSDVNSNFTIPVSSAENSNSTPQFVNDDQYSPRAYVENSTGYYNWYTATAGAGMAGVATDGTNVSSSIRPKGWRLPTGKVVGNNTTNEFYNLFDTMGLSIGSNLSNSSTVWTNEDMEIAQNLPYNFTFTGRMGSGELGYTSAGYWLSATVANSERAYGLSYDDGSYYPFDPRKATVSAGTGALYRHYGFPVRCIAR